MWQSVTDCCDSSAEYPSRAERMAAGEAAFVEWERSRAGGESPAAAANESAQPAAKGCVQQERKRRPPKKGGDMPAEEKPRRSTRGGAEHMGWRASLELQEDPESTAVALSVEGATEAAATAALAELLHQRVFSRAVSANEGENMNDYSSPIGFIESIRREHDSAEQPDSMTASLVWETLYDAVCTLTVERTE